MSWEYELSEGICCRSLGVMRLNKNCMVMTRALVNFSPLLRICSWLELRGKGIVSYVPQVREEQMVRICLYVWLHP